MTSIKKPAVLFLILGILLTFTACTSSVQRDYEQAEALLAQGNYMEAALKFETLGSYEEASCLLMYCRAALAAESGDFSSARNAFSALGSFRDAADMERYYEGRQMEAFGQGNLLSSDITSAISTLKNAAEIYGSVPGVLDASQRKDDCLNALYEQGIQLLDLSQYSSAYHVFDELGSFRNSTEMTVYCTARMLEAESAYLDAAERFLEIPSLLDAAVRADRDRELVYQQALYVTW